MRHAAAEARDTGHVTHVMENSNYNAGGTGANLFAGGAQAGQAASQVIKQ